MTGWALDGSLGQVQAGCGRGLQLGSATAVVFRWLRGRLGFAPQSVAAVIERAEHTRLVERRPHPVHGRVRQLFLTDAGNDAYARAASVIGALEENLADELNPPERRLLQRQLIGLASRAQVLTTAGGAGA
jgi:DNA-binding MarR family transcriptional regulator